MAVKINVAGRKSASKADKPATRSTRKSTAKPAAAKTGTKRTTTKRTTAAKPASAAKRAPGRPRKDGSAPVRRSTPNTNLDERTQKRLLSAVEKAGVARKKAEATHKAAVDNLHKVATEAMDAGVPMARVAEVSGISRQWLYKMGEFSGRSNGGGNKTAAKSAAKATTRPTSRGTRSTKASSGNGKSTRKTGSGRKISVRSAK